VKREEERREEEERRRKKPTQSRLLYFTLSPTLPTVSTFLKPPNLFYADLLVLSFVVMLVFVATKNHIAMYT